MSKSTVPKATLGRLPYYLQYLKNLPKDKSECISATTIAKELSLGEVQVRKDLNLVSGAGKPKVGYVTSDLIQTIEKYLGFSQMTKAVIVGAGKLGQALLEYDGFENYGVKIEAAFDIRDVHTKSKHVFKMDYFKEYCSKENIHIGIITVCESAAQSVCDKMVDSGITAIWNFAPCKLSVPDGILVMQENLALSLAHLNQQNIIKI